MQIITTHKNTDFDALASVVAASMLYPEATPVLPKTLNPNVKQFLSIHKDIFTFSEPEEIDLERIRSLIIVDVNCWSRLDRFHKLKDQSGIEILLWDHHGLEGDISSNVQHVEPMGANTTLMVRELKNRHIQLSPIQATLLLAGIYEDTGNLMFPSSKAEDAFAAGYLLENRADLSVIGSFLRPAYGEKQKNILFEMLKNADRMRINGYSVSINKLKLEGHVDSLAVVVRMYREIMNVDAAFGIFSDEEKGRCIVIGRSAIDGLNMGLIMKGLGGGGHPGAGSAMLKSVNPDAVEMMIVDLIQGNQQASVQISDLMSFPVFSISPNTTMEEAAKILREKGCTGLPVIENGRLVGMISRRDFKKIKSAGRLKAPVKAYMSTNVVTIEPGKSPMQAARLMVKYDVGRLPVVENDRVIGIITRSDTMMYFYDLLPD
uniref:CBS domain-containing protein n=1 Tax=Desulfatirhabdium butyrativorans TaxID=340467 RepID=A0A7C4VQP2_9BACT